MKLFGSLVPVVLGCLGVSDTVHVHRQAVDSVSPVNGANLLIQSFNSVKMVTIIDDVRRQIGKVECHIFWRLDVGKFSPF